MFHKYLLNNYWQPTKTWTEIQIAMIYVVYFIDSLKFKRQKLLLFYSLTNFIDQQKHVLTQYQSIFKCHRTQLLPTFATLWLTSYYYDAKYVKIPSFYNEMTLLQIGLINYTTTMIFDLPHTCKWEEQLQTADDVGMTKS